MLKQVLILVLLVLCLALCQTSRYGIALEQVNALAVSACYSTRSGIGETQIWAIPRNCQASIDCDDVCDEAISGLDNCNASFEFYILNVTNPSDPPVHILHRSCDRNSCVADYAFCCCEKDL